MKTLSVMEARRGREDPRSTLKSLLILHPEENQSDPR